MYPLPFRSICNKILQVDAYETHLEGVSLASFNSLVVSLDDSRSPDNPLGKPTPHKSCQFQRPW